MSYTSSFLLSIRINKRVSGTGPGSQKRREQESNTQSESSTQSSPNVSGLVQGPEGRGGRDHPKDPKKKLSEILGDRRVNGNIYLLPLFVYKVIYQLIPESRQREDY